MPYAQSKPYNAGQWLKAFLCVWVILLGFVVGLPTVADSQSDDDLSRRVTVSDLPFQGIFGLKWGASRTDLTEAVGQRLKLAADVCSDNGTKRRSCLIYSGSFASLQQATVEFTLLPDGAGLQNVSIRWSQHRNMGLLDIVNLCKQLQAEYQQGDEVSPGAYCAMYRNDKLTRGQKYKMIIRTVDDTQITMTAGPHSLVTGVPMLSLSMSSPAYDGPTEPSKPLKVVGESRNPFGF